MVGEGHTINIFYRDYNRTVDRSIYPSLVRHFFFINPSRAAGIVIGNGSVVASR